MDPVTGKPYNDEKPFRERYWRPTLTTALKIRYREPYQMRHTYATMAVMAEANPVWIARQMGNSPTIVFRHYARWIERMDRNREGNKLNTFLGQIWGKPEGDAGESQG
jgi:integrase